MRNRILILVALLVFLPNIVIADGGVFKHSERIRIDDLITET